MRWIVQWLVGDLRFSLRAWIRSPGPAAFILLTLAVGITCNVVAFSLVRALLVRPYPFRDLERLVVLREVRTGNPAPSPRLTPADLSDLSRDAAAFEDLASYRFTPMSVAQPAAGDPVRVRSFAVSPNLFGVLGVDAAHGRPLRSGDGQTGTDAVAVLSHGLWRRQFGGDPGAIGGTIVLNGRAHEIVGVMSPEFNFPRSADAWVPLVLSADEEQDRSRSTLSAIARLPADVTLDQARLDLDRQSRMLAERHPLTNTGRSLQLVRLREEQYEYTLPLFALLELAALFVLLAAAANAGSIHLAAQLVRGRELALRLTLGASRSRLIAGSLAEAVLLAALSACLAIPLSWWAVRVVRDALPRGTAIHVAGWDALRIDPAVLIFSTAITLVMGLIVGVIAALRLPRRPFPLLGGIRDVTASPRRVRRAAVVVQLVVALVLTSAAISILTGVRRLTHIFDELKPDGVMFVNVALPVERYASPASRAAFFTRVVDDLQKIPAVEGAAAIANLPASNVPNATTPFTIERRPPASVSDQPAADLQTVSGDALRVLRLPVVRGRGFLDSDTDDAMPAVLISEAMARRYWPTDDPIGQRIRLGSNEAEPWWTIVGIAGDVKQNWFDPLPRPIVYVSQRQRPVRTMSLMVRTPLEPHVVARPVKEQLMRLDAGLPLSESATLRNEVDDSLAPLRIVSAVLLTFSLVVFGLAVAGMYGVVAATVAQQTRELGARMALGATPSRILLELVGETMRLCAWGSAIGIPLSLGLHSFASAKLYNLASVDPAAFAALTSVLFAASLLASFLPARRALAIDPAAALRA